MASKRVAEAPKGFAPAECPITRERFRAKAPRTVEVTIAGKSYEADVKEFSTGSFGFFLNGKVNIEVDGVQVPHQIGLNLTAVGSKSAK